MSAKVAHMRLETPNPRNALRDAALPARTNKVRVRSALSALLLLGALAAALSGAGCAATPSKPVVDKKATLATPNLVGSSAIYVARERGFFVEEGVDATFVVAPSGSAAIDLVLNGQADFAATAETPVARDALKGKPLAVVATIAEVQHSNYVIARKDAGISVASDLEGKTVGVTRGTAADFFLSIYLTTKGIDPASVRIVSLKAEEVVDAMTSGQVDAVCSWPPYTTQIVDELGSEALVLDEPGLYTMSWNVVARRDLTQRDPDLIVRVLRAIARGTDYVADRPDEAQSITSKATGLDLAATRELWADYRTMMTLDQSLLLSLEDEARWMQSVESTGQPGIPNFLDFIYTDALKAVRPDDVRVIE